MTGILFVFDGPEHHDVVRRVIVQLPGEVGQIAKIAVDEAIQPRSSHIETIIETFDRRTAAGAIMRDDRTERIERNIHLVLDRPRRRLSAHVVDRAADRVHSRHQGRRTFQKLDLLEIGRAHPSCRDVRRAGPNSVVQNVHLAEAKTPHREVGRRTAGITRQHADRALCCVGGGAVALLLHRLPGDDVDGSRCFDDGQAQPACGCGDAVERRHGNPRQRLAGRRSHAGRRRGGGRQSAAGFLGSRLRLLARRFDFDRRQLSLILRDLVLRDLRRQRRRLRAAGACRQQGNSRQRRCGDEERTQCGNTAARATAVDDRQHCHALTAKP